MRLLIYGFGPYKQFKENITEKIVRRLPEKKGLRKIVFPVRFQKRQFIAAIKEYKPDTILGLGQSSRGSYLRIELRAVNRKRVDKTERPRSIVPGRSKWLQTNLRLDGGYRARLSYSAGDYVCNYSIYVILEYIRRNRLPTRFGFVHIPHEYSLARARRFLLKAVREIQTSQVSKEIRFSLHF